MKQMNSIFSFLKEYNELANPVITEIEKQKWSIRLTDQPHIDEVWSVFNAPQPAGEAILKVERPVLELCPVPDTLIVDWLIGKWKNIDLQDVAFEDKKIIEEIMHDGTVSYKEELFSDNPERLKVMDDWLQERQQWRIKQIPKQKGLELYNSLFGLYSDIKKEAESVELILGDGHIKWQTLERRIDHPVYLQKVSLEFNPEKPAFIVKCDDTLPEIYTPMLRVISSVNHAILSEVLQEVEENQYHIWDTENIKGLFQRLIQVVDSQGKLDDGTGLIEESEPVIKMGPILFLRKRTLGFSNLINGIIKDINESEGHYLPSFFGPMYGDYSTPAQQEIIYDNDWNQSGIDQDVLLTLPANNEQLKIIKYLNKYGAVLVQGPPGTGKTHTIANLIGHLLSEGNNILVTSHTEKALTVLKEKVYEDLRSLCLSLLSSSSQRKEMDSALFEIAEKNTSLDLGESLKRINYLEKERQQLINQLKNKQSELLQLRGLEYKDLIYDYQNITPIEAGIYVKQGQGRLDYIPGPTNDDTIGLPLIHSEIVKLYETNGLLDPEEALNLQIGLPKLSDLWDCELFQQRLEEWQSLYHMYADCNQRMFNLESIEIENLQELEKEIESILKEIDGMASLNQAIISTSLQDKVYFELWEAVIAESESLLQTYESYRKLIFENEVELGDEFANEDNLSILKEIIASGREKPVTILTVITKPRWKKVKDNIKLNSKQLDVLEDYKLVYEVLTYQLKRKSIIRKINKLILQATHECIDESSLERRLDDFKNIVAAVSQWQERWQLLTQKLIVIASSKEQLNQTCTLDSTQPFNSMKSILAEQILPQITGTIGSLRLQKINSEWKTYTDLLLKISPSYKGTVFTHLLKAVTEKNQELYGDAYAEFQKLQAKAKVYHERRELLEKLAKHVPGWAEAIEKRQGVHGYDSVPADIQAAWQWLQLNSQIARINNYDPNAIQDEIHQINKQLIENAKRLAYEKAWYNKVRNTNIEQNQAIEGWRQTMRQVGKGKGVKAPRLLQQARELMPKCQAAIPVWIMPLNRVAESFDPQKNKFDVVIIDEASQADLLALGALYLGRKVIIVGDDEQVSPNVVGLKNDEINALIEQFLQGIPNRHLYNSSSSVYDLAKASGFKPLMLTEHFRCLPEIINFSNQLSYNGKIRPLRDVSNVNIRPAVVDYRVAGASQDNKVNNLEAVHIASLIIACTENTAYQGKTIGVISLLGQEQSYAIDKMLQTNLDPKVYEQFKIQCGSPAQFQGDERDVIFLSMVYGPKVEGGPIRLLSEDGNNDLTRKRYNVAASRAKDQMWVVHSLNPDIDLKPDDIRLRLIKYAQDPRSVLEFDLSSTESDFEKQVMQTLLNQGYKVISQFPVGAYRIDLVVQDGINRVAIECDGGKWHTIDHLPNDLKRQATLERLGWRFIRIRGSAFYSDPDKTMQWVFAQLEKHKIKPNYHGVEESSPDTVTNESELIESIKLRALDIRKAWQVEESESFLTVDAIEKQHKEQLELVSKTEPVDNISQLQPVKVSISSDTAKGSNLNVQKNLENQTAESNTNLPNKAIDKQGKRAKNKNIKDKLDKNNQSTLQKPLFDFTKN